MKDSLEVYLPSSHSLEIKWIVSVLLGEILGIAYTVVPSSNTGYTIRAGDKRLDLPDVFFSNTSSHWLQESSLPSASLKLWDGKAGSLYVPRLAEPLPVLFGDPRIQLNHGSIRCDIDIFGSAFFMLSRYEEVVLRERDTHDRFPGKASTAYKMGFLYRPIVDEYIEILWACMQHLWPGLERRSSSGRVHITCDVDAPFDCNTAGVRRTIRSSGRDLVRYRQPLQSLERIRNFLAARRGDYRYDPFYTFDWYMDTCEHYGRQAAFYFIPDHSAEGRDGCYDIFEKRVRVLMQKIADRGHEIGTHGSFSSYKDGEQVLKERHRIVSACKQAGVSADVCGTRQHYLRWDAAQTPDYLDAAGYEYDTTGGYADVPGFRYGTAHTFTMWSWKKRTPLRIKQRPLILMECSVIAERYLGLGYTEEALKLMLELKERALRFGGNFTFLWHNSHLQTQKDREFFEALIQ